MKSQKIKPADNNIISNLTIPHLNLSMFLSKKEAISLTYYVYHFDKLIFYGNDFIPSSLSEINSLETMIDLLFFITRTKVDADPDYFSTLSIEQIKWTETSECILLSNYVSDFYNIHSDGHAQSKIFFDKYFTSL